MLLGHGGLKTVFTCNGSPNFFFFLACHACATPSTEPRQAMKSSNCTRAQLGKKKVAFFIIVARGHALEISRERTCSIRIPGSGDVRSSVHVMSDTDVIMMSSRGMPSAASATGARP